MRQWRSAWLLPCMLCFAYLLLTLEPIIVKTVDTKLITRCMDFPNVQIMIWWRSACLPLCMLCFAYNSLTIEIASVTPAETKLFEACASYFTAHTAPPQKEQQEQKHRLPPGLPAIGTTSHPHAASPRLARTHGTHDTNRNRN